jgi:hypothetical protein
VEWAKTQALPKLLEEKWEGGGRNMTKDIETWSTIEVESKRSQEMGWLTIEYGGDGIACQMVSWLGSRR